MKNINISKKEVRKQKKQRDRDDEIKELNRKNKELKQEIKSLKNFIDHTPLKNKERKKKEKASTNSDCPKCQSEIKTIHLKRIDGMLILRVCKECGYKETLKPTTDLIIS